jgi:hypothetical protein
MTSFLAHHVASPDISVRFVSAHGDVVRSMGSPGAVRRSETAPTADVANPGGSKMTVALGM